MKLLSVYTVYFLLVNIVQTECGNSDSSMTSDSAEEHASESTEQLDTSDNSDDQNLMASSGVGVDPSTLHDVLSTYTAEAFSELKDTSQDSKVVKESLRKAIPKLQHRLTDYSRNMYASSIEQPKPNPLLMGLALGLKRWTEGISVLMPQLRSSSHVRYEDPDDNVETEIEERCFTEASKMCYEQTVLVHSHPHLCCPLFFAQY